MVVAGSAASVSVIAHRGASEAATNVASLFLGRAAPDARVLVGLECVIEALDIYRAFAAHLLRAIDLQQCVAGGAYRKEQIRIGVTANCVSAPGVVSI